MKKKALIFDFDGTVVDSMTRLTDVAATVMSRYFSLPIAEAKRLYQLTSGLPFNEQLSTLYPGNPDNEKAADTFESTKRIHYFEEPLFEDALETLIHLKEKGYFLAVSSSNDQHLVEAFVKQKNLPFDVALGWTSATFGKGKPHFQYLQKQNAFADSDMVFIGDSLKDAERALDCGIDFIGKTGMFDQKEFLAQFPQITTISALSELKELFS